MTDSFSPMEGKKMSKEVLGMTFAEAIGIMDDNAYKEMLEEMRVEVEDLRQERACLIRAKDAAIADMDAIIADKDTAIADMDAVIARLSRLFNH